jgi:putative membrane protein
VGQPEERLPDVVDATRRTRLASERTFLAWWRSGLTALAVGIGAGKLVPEISGGSQWTFVVLGAGYALLGVVFILFGYYRERALEQALNEGRYEPLNARISLLLTLCGVLLGAATIIVLFTDAN